MSRRLTDEDGCTWAPGVCQDCGYEEDWVLLRDGRTAACSCSLCPECLHPIGKCDEHCAAFQEAQAAEWDRLECGGRYSWWEDL